MSQHPNARLTPRGRELLCERVGGEAHRRGPVTPVRYERGRPGELVHVDVKKVARIPDGDGHRALGRGYDSRPGTGTSCLHVAVDDNGQVAYAELLPDERKRTACAFMARALAFYEEIGVGVKRVMAGNGPGVPLRRLQRDARRLRDQAQVHEAVQPLAERQGRAHEPDLRPRVAARPR